MYTSFQALCAFAILYAFSRILRHLIGQSGLANIPGPPSKSLWKGNFREVFNLNGWEFHKHIMDSYGRVVRINGIFGDTQLFVYDPRALHHILVKDQHVYEEPSTFIATNKLTFGNGLLTTLGDHHRKQRKMLNPVFSTNHMRYMTPIFYDISNKLRNSIASKLKNGPQEIEMMRWLTRTALELVGQGGLGYSFDTLSSDDEPKNPYAQSLKHFIPTLTKMLITRQFLPWIGWIGPAGFRRWLVDILPWKNLRDTRDMVDIMHNTSMEILAAKKQALSVGDESVLQQVGGGKDIMSILLKANMEASEDDRLPEEELLAQMSTLTFAAMDTTSSALARILYLLAQNPEVQERLREKIKDARAAKGDLTYDELTALPYLEAVCRETLRLYPPVPFASRTTRKEIVLPLSEPITGQDGTQMKEIRIPNNTNVIVGIMASNRDPERWGPDVLEWKPERWLSPLPEKLTQPQVPGVYSNMMTFIGGGRACIGFKFSQMEMKIVLSLLLDSFRFRPSKSEVLWKLGAIVFPVNADTGSMEPTMPLNVELLEREEQT